MKADSSDSLNLAPREERAILDEIRNDRDLIRRLHITPQELEALSKCALLGTLTCKQDMLFILRQIREATSTTIDHTALFPKPSQVEEVQGDRAPNLRGIVTHTAPPVIHEPGSLDNIVRRRIPEQFGVLFWVIVLVVGLVWNGLLLMSRWRDNFMTTISTQVSQIVTPDAWYTKLDHLNVLLFWEILIVAGIGVAMYVKSRRDSRRFRIRRGRRAR